MDHYLGVAKDKEITENELGAVQAIVMAVSAGKPMMQFLDVIKRTSKKNLSVAPDCGEIC